jgi:hypothetical protein
MELSYDDEILTACSQPLRPELCQDPVVGTVPSKRFQPLEKTP